MDGHSSFLRSKWPVMQASLVIRELSRGSIWSYHSLSLRAYNILYRAPSCGISKHSVEPCDVSDIFWPAGKDYSLIPVTNFDRKDRVRSISYALDAVDTEYGSRKIEILSLVIAVMILPSIVEALQWRRTSWWQDLLRLFTLRTYILIIDRGLQYVCKNAFMNNFEGCSVSSHDLWHWPLFSNRISIAFDEHVLSSSQPGKKIRLTLNI